MIVCECGNACSADQLKAQLAECGAQVEHSFRLIPGVAVGMSPDALKRFFNRYPGARVVPDRRRHIPPMPFGPDDWKDVAGPGEGLPTSPAKPQMSPLALTLMKADEVHTMGIDGSGVRVCVVDSGIDFSHPDLLGLALLGADGQPLAADFTETDLTDTIGHGTAVAGCIAAQARQVYTITDDQTGKPIAYSRIKGVAPGVRLMSAKVFDTRVASGYDSTIIAALEWAAQNGAHIVNMSLGGVSLPNDGSDPLSQAVSSLREQGILVMVSAGNEGGGLGTLKSPGSSLGALTVGASTMYRSFAEIGFLAENGKWTADQLAAFSSLGPSADGRVKPEILAPGAFDWGLAPAMGSEEGQLYQLFGGTSQAAPLAAGAAALIYQAFHKARGRYPTPDELIRIICSTADDLGMPPHMQGAGRVNCLKAVQLVQGESQAVAASLPPVLTVQAGKEAKVTVEVTNVGTDMAEVRVSAFAFESLKGLSKAFQGEITQAQTTQHMRFDVAPGIDLMQVSLDWPSEDHGPTSPRLMVALYDPKGQFVNYQRPNGSGDVELGKSVDTWVARPMPGRWSARIVLRLGQKDTVQPFTLSMRAFRRSLWSWVTPDGGQVQLAAGETRPVTLRVTVPDGAIPGAYSGHVAVGSTAVPLGVVVPISLDRGQGSFSGSFQHGYQGSWGNGDWLYHDLPVPAGTRSLVASLQWPDVDNALEFYLLDPKGAAVMGRSNSNDAMDDGDTEALGSQIVLANPTPGNWRLALHSFAFCGRGMPEPYLGTIETAGELVTPRTVQLRVSPGEQAPVALLVRNPGRMPLTVHAVAQSSEPRLMWQPVTAQIKSGVTKEGQAEGEGHVTVASVNVPFGAREVGVCLNWEAKETQVSVSLFDPVAQSDRSTAAGNSGQLTLVEPDPVPGEWTILAGVTTATVENQTVDLSGAIFVVTPQVISDAEVQPVTIQPGSSAVLPLTLRLTEGSTSLAGRIVVTSSKGDQLGEVPFRIQAAEDGAANAEVAATKDR